MRNPIMHVFLHYEDLKHICNSLYAMDIYKICLLRRFWYAETILNVVWTNQIQDVHQTPSLKECYL